MTPHSEVESRNAFPTKVSPLRLPPEHELALLCARTRLTSPTKARVRQLLNEEPLDEDHLTQWAIQNGIVPLLYRHLQTFPAAPAQLVQKLGAHAKRTAISALHKTQELLRLLGRLEDHDVPALPFKGPVLSSRVYGDVSLRMFGDLDIFVPRDHLPTAKRLLTEEGYRLSPSMSPREEARRLKVEKSYNLVRDDVIVELHWRFLHPMHGFSLDPEAVWARTHSTEIKERDVRTLAPEDLVLYLCAHGGKHFWSRLSWICDVAEVLRTCSDTLHWPTVLKRAKNHHAERMLLLGLTLAHTYLHAPLPDSVAQAAERNEAVQQLTDQVRKRVFQPSSDTPSGVYADARQELKNARFHLLMRERLRDRLPYYRHLLKLAITPNEKDEALLSLPDGLSWLYYLMRPIRLLRDAAKNGLHALQSQAQNI